MGVTSAGQRRRAAKRIPGWRTTPTKRIAKNAGYAEKKQGLDLKEKRRSRRKIRGHDG